MRNGVAQNVYASLLFSFLFSIELFADVVMLSYLLLFDCCFLNFQDPRLKEMEKILDCEVRAIEGDAESSSSREKQKHYLVKWKGISHIHCTWSVFFYTICIILLSLKRCQRTALI
jgi:Chromo (CHRromatin Organisation MOdifier) domain